MRSPTQAGAGEQVERIDPIRYSSYYGYISTLVMLFVAAQAPELLGRDQRYHVLSLYFSRALLRIDYVVAKAAAFATAILILILIPQAVIFVGLVISNADVVAAIGDNIGSVGPVLAVAAVIAGLLGSIGLAISAFTPRRAYATAAIMAIFIVPGVVAQLVLRSTTGGLTRYIVLAAPGSVIEGVNAFLFGTKPGAPGGRPGQSRRRALPRGRRRGRRGPARDPGAPLPEDRGMTDGTGAATSPSAARRARPRPSSSARSPAGTATWSPSTRSRSRWARRDGPARPQRRRQVDPAPHDGRAPAAVARRREDPRPSRPGSIRTSTARWASSRNARRSTRYLTGRQFALFNAQLQRLPDPAAAATRALEAVDLIDVQHRQIGTYSKGMRQRAKIAAALVHDPRVLLLDEPFNGMDPRQRLHMMELLRSMAAAGRTILFSSHILEEVERLADDVLVVYAGRLAASGDFREIRRLMTDRPHTFTVRSSDDRRLASQLVASPSVFGVELVDGMLTVRASEFAAFTMLLPRAARDAGITLFELRPTDESLESVFAYLVRR